jgi:hypothetical protein
MNRYDFPTLPEGALQKVDDLTNMIGNTLYIVLPPNPSYIVLYPNSFDKARIFIDTLLEVQTDRWPERTRIRFSMTTFWLYRYTCLCVVYGSHHYGQIFTNYWLAYAYALRLGASKVKKP